MATLELFNTPPTHISVGAILINDQNEVLVHHFEKTPWEGLENIYILMRESLEDNESLEAAVHRGLSEEFGATGEITRYLGPIISRYAEDSTPGQDTEKTTLYFLVRLGHMDESTRAQDDPEKDSELQWHPASLLIEKMQEQGRRYPGRTDLDESDILKRL